MEKMRFLRVLDSPEDLEVLKNAKEDLQNNQLRLIRFFWCAEGVLGSSFSYYENKRRVKAFAVWFSNNWVLDYKHEEFCYEHSRRLSLIFSDKGNKVVLPVHSEDQLRVFLWQHLKPKNHRSTFWYPPVNRFPNKDLKLIKEGGWSYFFSIELPYH